jgi:amino acid transporter
MLLGTIAVAAVYVTANLAFVHALGLDGLRGAKAVAGQVLELGLGAWGDRVISVLICISALGAINGQVFTGSRIYYAMGTEHRLYAPLGVWSRHFGTPVWSLAIQAAITLATVIVFGLLAKETLTKAGFGSGFERMVIFTGPIFWGFLFLVGIALFVLRVRDRDTPRPFRVPGYPLVPIVFCAFSLFMAYSSLTYAISQRSHIYEAVWALAALGLGIVAAVFDLPPTPSAEPHEQGS